MIRKGRGVNYRRLSIEECLWKNVSQCLGKKLQNSKFAIVSPPNASFRQRISMGAESTYETLLENRTNIDPKH